MANFLRKLQLAQAATHQLRTDDLVLVEGDIALLVVGAGSGLTTVVQQCRPAQHEVRFTGFFLINSLPHDLQGVLIDILVLAVFILRHAHIGNLRQHAVGQPRFHHQVDTTAGICPQDELVQLSGDALNRDAVNFAGHFLQRLEYARRHVEPELGCEAAGTQHAQGIIAKADLRRPRGVQDTRDKILETSERVEEGASAVAMQFNGDGVTAEVTAD